jgi:hypothetical protein
MLSLDDKRWSSLKHAYGEASNIPALLRQLKEFPPYKDYESEPYFSLWSALCHQGDVYTASYAAVPHLVAMLREAPSRAHWSAVLLVCAIEIARANNSGPKIGKEFEPDYLNALAALPQAIAAMSVQRWDEPGTRACAAALAAAKGHPALAEAILELEPDRLESFKNWVEEG